MSGTIEITRSFAAMNTEVEAIICLPASEQVVGEKALLQLQQLFHEVEAKLSRFKPDSELSRLNQADGHPFSASSLLFTIVQMAKEAAQMTSGIFDPTILPYLLAAGYDRSFEKLSDESDSPLYQMNGRFTWQDIALNRDLSTITLPAGAGIDLGGIAKGWTVDRAVETLKQFPGYAIDAGGDMTLGGRMADGACWSVGVVNPLDTPDNLTVLELTDCAVCTSSTQRRRWRVEGVTAHHLIDPRNRKPAASEVISATIIAESAATAEVIAKTALILGPDDGIQFIRNRPGVKGILVLNDGELLRSEDFREVECVH